METLYSIKKMFLKGNSESTPNINNKNEFPPLPTNQSQISSSKKDTLVENQNLNTFNSDLNISNNEIEYLKKEIDRKNSSNSILNNELLKYKKELEIKNSTIVQLNNEIRTISSESNRVRSENTSSNSRMEKILVEKNSLNTELNKIKKENEKLKISLEKCLTRLEQLHKDQEINFSNHRSEKENLANEIKQSKEEMEKYQVVMAQQNSLLDQRDSIIHNYSEQLKKEKEKSAEIVSNFGTANKFKEVQLNNNLPSVLNLRKLFEGLIVSIDDYYLNTQLVDLSNEELSSFLREIVKVSMENCFNILSSPFEKLFNEKPTELQMFFYKSLVYGSFDIKVKDSMNLTLEKLHTVFNKILLPSDRQKTIDFVKICCTFIWNVFLTQPQVMFGEFNDKESKNTLYSPEYHIPFNNIESKNVKLVVNSIIVPSIYKMDTNQLETQSYVFVKEEIESFKSTSEDILVENKKNPDSSDHKYSISISTDVNMEELDTSEKGFKIETENAPDSTKDLSSFLENKTLDSMSNTLKDKSQLDERNNRYLEKEISSNFNYSDVDSQSYFYG